MINYCNHVEFFELDFWAASTNAGIDIPVITV